MKNKTMAQKVAMTGGVASLVVLTVGAGAFALAGRANAGPPKGLIVSQDALIPMAAKCSATALDPVATLPARDKSRGDALSTPFVAKTPGAIWVEFKDELCTNPSVGDAYAQMLQEVNVVIGDNTWNIGKLNSWLGDMTKQSKHLRTAWLQTSDGGSTITVTPAYKVNAEKVLTLLLQFKLEGIHSWRSSLNWPANNFVVASGELPYVSEAKKAANQESYPALILAYTRKSGGCNTSIGINIMDKRPEIFNCTKSTPPAPVVRSTTTVVTPPPVVKTRRRPPVVITRTPPAVTKTVTPPPTGTHTPPPITVTSTPPPVTTTVTPPPTTVTSTPPPTTVTTTTTSTPPPVTTTVTPPPRTTTHTPPPVTTTVTPPPTTVTTTPPKPCPPGYIWYPHKGCLIKKNPTQTVPPPPGKTTQPTETHKPGPSHTYTDPANPSSTASVPVTGATTTPGAPRSSTATGTLTGAPSGSNAPTSSTVGQPDQASVASGGSNWKAELVGVGIFVTGGLLGGGRFLRNRASTTSDGESDDKPEKGGKYGRK